MICTALPIKKTKHICEALCELLQRHFKPKRFEAAESYRFHRCCQENGTLSVYNARLRHLGATSIFGEFLNCSLRDQFVFGIRNHATPKNWWVKTESFKRLSKWLSPTKWRVKKLWKCNSNNCLNQWVQLRRSCLPYRHLLRLLRGRLLAIPLPHLSRWLLMLAFHAVVLTM